MRTFVTFLIVSGAAVLVGMAGLTVRFWPGVKYFGTYLLEGLLSKPALETAGFIALGILLLLLFLLRKALPFVGILMVMFLICFGWAMMSVPV